MGLDVEVYAFKEGIKPPELIGGTYSTDSEIMRWRKPYELMCVFDVLLNDDGFVDNGETYPITIDKLEKIIELYNKWFISKTEEPTQVNFNKVWHWEWVDSDYFAKRANDLKLLLEYMKINSEFDFRIWFSW